MNVQAVHPIVIIGAGPAGIATAIEVLKRGYTPDQVILIEKSGEIAHMISSKYPEEKPVLANYKERMAECIGDLCITDMSKSDFMNYIKNVVKEKKLKIYFHEQVETITKLNNRQFKVKTSRDTYICDAIFVAIGNMSSPRTLAIKVDGEVNGCIHYDLQQITKEMKKILVVGGGDSAGEYAKILVDRGHQVTISYRGEDFSRMLPVNKEIALNLIKNHQLRFLPSSNLERIENSHGHPLVFFQEPHYESEEFDAIVTALGTERPTKYLASLGIETAAEEGDEIYSESSMEGLFLVGDLASGKKGGSITFAFNSGTKAVAQACSLYLDCN